MLTAREILWTVVFCGFAVNYMNRSSINITIVSMVESKGVQNYSGACFREQRNLSVASEHVGERFSWDEKVQNYILGGFYWFHWVLQIPGGVLARKWGTKLVFGWSNFLCTLCLFVFPWAAKYDYKAVIVLRVFQGFISGLAWPSMHNMVAQWTTSKERSKFVSAYLGSSVGNAVTYPLCGYLINSFGWESVFYITGGLGVLWFFAWNYLAYDSPRAHPRIKASEKAYIESKIGNDYLHEKLDVPWLSILTSKAVWVCVIAQLGATWSNFTLMTQSPTYFGRVIGLSVFMTGIISGIPHLTRAVFSIAFASLADYLIKHDHVSVSTMRKLAAGTAMIGGAVFVAIIPLCGCNALAAVLALILAVGLDGAFSSGALANLVDITPNFAGVSMGLTGAMTVPTGTISAFVVGIITFQNQSLEQWRKVFFVTAAISVVTSFVYLLFSTTNIQKWNYPKNIQRPEEMKSLNQKLHSDK